MIGELFIYDMCKEGALIWVLGTALVATSIYNSYLRAHIIEIEAQNADMKAVSEQNQVKSNDVVRIQQKRSSRPKIGKVEICLSDIESIVEAIRGGADSIEICCARSDGGITPSIGICEEAVNLTRNTNTVVNVLIRPRDGNFVYSATEFDVIVRDILALRRLGVDGVVVGCLDAAGNVDRTQLSILRAITQGMVLTFHRAFDVCANPTEDLETIIAAGCDRLLTSGGCSSAGSPKVVLKF